MVAILITMLVGGEDPLANYSPAIAPHIWAQLQDFVVDAVVDVRGRTPYSDLDLALIASRLTLWAWETAGMNLDRGQIFSRSTIGRFIAVGLPGYNDAGRGNLRSQLLRMSEVLLSDRRSPRTLEALGPAHPSRPYTPKDLISLRSWADGHSTSARRANAEVLLALGLGAGLSASEIGDLRVRDIIVNERGVDLTVGGTRARVVPVVRAWEGALRSRVVQLDGDRFAFRENHTVAYDNLISNFVDRSIVRGPRPETQRMRATWIVHHLSNCAPVTVLMRAAGVSSLEAFTRYVGFVEDIESMESLR
jgi:integrase